MIQIFQENLKKSIIEIEQNKASMIVERTQAFFKNVTDSLLFLVRDENFKKEDPSHARGHLNNFLYQNDSLMELTLLNEKGQETIKVSKYGVVGPTDLKDQSKTHMFRAASEGQIFYGNLHLTPEGFHTMVIAVPIEKYRGRIIGVLTAKINLQHLLNLISKTWIGEKRSVCVMDQEGYLIADHNLSPLLFGPFIDRVIAGKEGSLEFKHPRGEKVLVIYKPIKELRWGVIVQVPIEEVYGPVKEIIHSGIIWILITLSIAILLSLFLTRKLTLPIKRLSKEMGEVAKGNLDTHIQATTKDEVGYLTESFNQMIRNLKQSQEAIKKAEEKYRNIFEDSKDMIYITSADGTWIDVNQSGVEMFGYTSKEELMKIPVKETYFDPEERKKFQSEIAKRGFVKDFEVKLKRKDGTPIEVLITATAIRDEGGQIIGYEGIIKDISPRKKMEEELIRRTEETQTLYDLSNLINQSLDLENILPEALDRAMGFIGFEIGSIYLYNPNEEILELKFNKGFPPHIIERVKTLKYGEGVGGKTVAYKKPIIISIDEYPSPQILQSLKGENIQTLVGIPLLSKEKAIGAITLSSRSIRHLTQREINLLESIGNQIGLALENAKLFSDVVKAKSEWETTFDAVTDLITIRDKDYRILRANKAAFKRYGLPPQEMIGKKCYELLNRRETPCEGCYVSEALITKKPAFGERESQYLNGIFQYFTFPVYNEVGEVIAVVDLAREITEERRLEREKEVVNNVNKILASSLDVRQVTKAVHTELKKVVYSERMTFILLDEESEEFRYYAMEKDYDAQELMEGVTYPLKNTFAEEVMKTGNPIIVSNIENIEGGKYWICEKLLKEGIHSLIVFPLEYKGKIFGTMSLGSKATNCFSEGHLNILQQIASGLAISIQNSLLLEEIKHSEEKYRIVVEGAHDGICVIGKDNRFKYVNHRLAEIFGYLDEELIGTDFRDIVDEESQRLMADRFTRRERGEKLSSSFELNAVRKDGEIRNIEINAKVMKDSQGEINYIVFVKDITEKKRMEEQLLQVEKLRALGEMASGVAHDFNNALAAILGNTQLLLYTAQDEETREALKTIEKVTRDSAQTVKRLQEFTRKRARQELFKLDVNSIVKDAIEITKPKWRNDAQGKGIHIEVLSSLGEVPSAAGDASELREVITNLIFNAVEAMPQGGTIEFRTFRKGGEVHLRIADTGIGMDEETRKKIFEPFFTTKPFSNTGLGLSMSYGIIRRFNGEIKVESKVGSGTAFTIILPVAVEAKEAVTPHAMIKPVKPARILVIDDEATVREVLEKMLSQVDHRVTVAQNGDEGIRLFQEMEFDMVLTDLGMPDMSGWEVCQKIKKVNPYTPVGMITGWGMEVSQSKMEECGLDFIIAKPFDFNQIIRVVSEKIEPRT
ncbi:MAG: PAS domain S-box protein [Thermodesulfobacteriota bacterium]|nr:PAS domain S-box protein [Thermodesulfobacteriota bacterium]